MEKFNNHEEQLKWFKDRVGKVIWRNKTTCDCLVCDSVYRNGLMVQDEFHASYISDLVSDYAAEGSVLEYFDTKEERDEFEQSLTHQNLQHDTRRNKK